MFRKFSLISIISIFILILAACNLPAKSATQDPNVVFTAAALTVQAQSTQLAPFNTPTLPPPAATNTVVVLPTLAVPTNTPLIPPTPLCDLAQFVKDVTIPDGTIVAPGATFQKTWRLRNIGTCTWSGYTLVFDSGEAMNPTIGTMGTVAPGQEVDVSVTFTAPSTPNTYRSYWRVRNSAGVLLPVAGGTDGESLYVEVKVAYVSSGFDFYSQAPNAPWISGVGNLTFGGPDTDTNGFAMYKNSQKLEDGSTSPKTLETSPQLVTDGVITGRYPAYTVTSGEHFTAKIGFLAQSDGTCGSGNVKFQLNYRDAGVLKPLAEGTKSCNGALQAVDVNLTPLAGKSVEFVLGVLANGPATQDWAVWVAPQIAIPQ